MDPTSFIDTVISEATTRDTAFRLAAREAAKPIVEAFDELKKRAAPRFKISFRLFGRPVNLAIGSRFNYKIKETPDGCKIVTTIPWGRTNNFHATVDINAKNPEHMYSLQWAWGIVGVHKLPNRPDSIQKVVETVTAISCERGLIV